MIMCVRERVREITKKEERTQSLFFPSSYVQLGEGEAQSLSFVVNKIWNETAQQHEKDEKKVYNKPYDL